jgi:hypothetical protein
MKKAYKFRNVKFKSKFGIQKRRIQFETLTSYLSRGGVVNNTKLKASPTPNSISVREIFSIAA